MTHSRRSAVSTEGASESGTASRGRIPPPERKELERLRGGDRAALAAFFDRYFDWIYGIACRLLGDRTLAEDVSQDVFLRVHRGAGRLDPGRDPLPWLTAVVCNACREHWRGRHQKAASRSVSIDALGDWEKAHPRAEGDPAQELMKEERHRRVRRAVIELPETLREVVVMHDFQGMSHKEVASSLGTTHAAVRKRYSRALAALAQRLKDDRT